MTERDPNYIRYSDAPIENDWSSIGNSASTDQERDPSERIREDVCDRLMQFGPEDCSTIDVSVRNGIVTVGGTLATRAMRDRAVEVVSSVAGVQGVENQLRVAGE